VAHQAYVSIRGTKQGQFKGESEGKGQDWTEIVSIQMGSEVPVDPKSGRPKGPRQHQPLTITKQVGAASPQLLQAHWMDEVLQSVDIQFTKGNGSGQEVVYQTIHLTNAQISRYQSYTGPVPHGAAPGHKHETLTLQYEGQLITGGGGLPALVGQVKRFGNWA
jgi:type VI secretion system secreted protein Hcp